MENIRFRGNILDVKRIVLWTVFSAIVFLLLVLFFFCVVADIVFQLTSIPVL